MEAYGRRGEVMGLAVLLVPGGSFPVGRDCDVDGDIVCLFAWGLY